LFSRPAKNRSRGCSQSGKLRVMDSMPSPNWVSEKNRYEHAPPAPELLEMTAATRWSKAAPMSEVLPLREWPVSAIRVASTVGRVVR
jgi:hypothetical protein